MRKCVAQFKEIVEDASTRARPGEDGTGQPVKCGPPARKTGTRRAAAVEERAGQGIASAECSHGGRAAATAKSYSRVYTRRPPDVPSTSSTRRSGDSAECASPMRPRARACRGTKGNRERKPGGTTTATASRGHVAGFLPSTRRLSRRLRQDDDRLRGSELLRSLSGERSTGSQGDRTVLGARRRVCSSCEARGEAREGVTHTLKIQVCKK